MYAREMFENKPSAGPPVKAISKRMPVFKITPNKREKNQKMKGMLSKRGEARTSSQEILVCIARPMVVGSATKNTAHIVKTCVVFQENRISNGVNYFGLRFD